MTVLDVDVEKTDILHNGKVYVSCICSCGTCKTVTTSNLVTGNTKSCGCKNHKTGPKIDLVGQKFGKLTVKRLKRIDEYPNKKRKKIEWYCDCECGTKDHLVSSDHLKRGDVKSCGCLRRKTGNDHKMFKDLTGMVFGRLTVLHRAKNADTGNKTRWFCKCKCGNTKIVKSRDLLCGDVKSCGCMISKNEEVIRRLLISNDINFKTQFWFNDLRNDKTNVVLRFDFAIFDKNGFLIMLIEYDGEQHFKEMRFSSNPKRNKEKLESTKYCDNLKNKYCKQNGFSLFRIPYTYEDEVEKLVLGALKEKGLIIERND